MNKMLPWHVNNVHGFQRENNYTIIVTHRLKRGFNRKL